MAEQPSKNSNKIDHERLEEVALEIFSSSMATGVNAAHMNFAAERSFQGAAAFLEHSEKIRNGAPIKPLVPTGPQFAKCCAINLPVRHPLNLVAELHTRKDGTKAGGDMKLVNRVWERIKNVDAENAEGDFKIEDSDLAIDWSRDTIVTAKKLLKPLVDASVN